VCSKFYITTTLQFNNDQILAQWHIVSRCALSARTHELIIIVWFILGVHYPVSASADIDLTGTASARGSCRGARPASGQTYNVWSGVAKVSARSNASKSLVLLWEGTNEISGTIEKCSVARFWVPWEESDSKLANEIVKKKKKSSSTPKRFPTHNPTLGNHFG